MPLTDITCFLSFAD